MYKPTGAPKNTTVNLRGSFQPDMGSAVTMMEPCTLQEMAVRAVEGDVMRWHRRHEETRRGNCE
jgi:hypothetical protein